MISRTRSKIRSSVKAIETLVARFRVVRGDGGGALVETALILMFLAPVMIIGTIEFASLAYAEIEIANAAHTGAAYALEYYQNPATCDFSTLPTDAIVTNAAQQEVTDITGMMSGSLTAAMATGCNGGAATTGNTVPSCTTGTLPYLQVTATATVSPWITYSFPGVPSTFTFTQKAILNIVN
jgi:Flp pilus assembly protein TadG